MTQQNKGLKAHQSSMICSGDYTQGFGEKMLFFFFSPILIHVHEQGCALCKIEGTPVLSYPGCPTHDFYAKKIFLVAQEQKLGAMGHQALLEHSFEEITQIRNK